MGSVTDMHPPEKDDRLRAAARSWIIRVAEEPGAEPACAAWRAEQPAHEHAWQEASTIWRQAAMLGALDRPDWRAEIDGLTQPAWRRYAPWAMAASVVLAVGATFYMHNLPDFETQTRTAEIRKMSLSDGSRVTLAAASGMAVSYHDSGRRVVLDHGQAFFEVAHDRARPFTVVAGNAEIRVTGTKFDVRRVGDDIQVVVLEGRVEVRKRSLLPSLMAGTPDRVLTAGFRSELAPGASRFSEEAQTQVPAGEWRTGRLYYSEAPLSDIIADVQRYSTTPIRIDDPAVARLKVTTSFRANRLQAFLDDLQESLPIRQRRTANGIIIESRNTSS